MGSSNFQLQVSKTVEIIPALDSEDKLLNLLKQKSNLVSAPS
jgi:hypothetical protein